MPELCQYLIIYPNGLRHILSRQKCSQIPHISRVHCELKHGSLFRIICPCENNRKARIYRKINFENGKSNAYFLGGRNNRQFIAARIIQRFWKQRTFEFFRQREHLIVNAV